MTRPCGDEPADKDREIAALREALIETREWAENWHRVAETMCLLVGLHQGLGADEMAAEFRDKWDRHRTQIAALREALKDAIECVNDWGAYASSYFQEKHGLKGDIERLTAALSGSPAPDPAEAMRAKCEEIAREEVEANDYTHRGPAVRIADAIAALKGN